MNAEPPRRRDPWGGGIALAAVGLVVPIPSGLCTAALYGASHAPDWGTTVLTFGAPAMAVGAALSRSASLAYRK